ncbi:MAG: hypothetical protein IIW23_03945 [Clostridia bacterium]|nr:hypothetical protein [Clostridia bacterium]
MGLFCRNKENSRRFKKQIAQKVGGHRLRYVTQRDADGNEDILGKGGGISFSGDRVNVFSENGRHLTVDIYEAKIYELMSNDGAVVSGTDIETGEKKTVVAYYVYYRK